MDSRSRTTVLIDYDNLGRLFKARGVNNLVSAVAQGLPGSAGPSLQLMHVRLYGGWVEDGRFSKAGQDLVPELENLNGSVLSAQTATGGNRFALTIELARSLISAPRIEIPTTFKTSAIPTNLRSKKLPFHGCVQTDDCRYRELARLVDGEHCSHHGCTAKLRHMLCRSTQKRVDAMIVLDLNHLAKNPATEVVVVSSDSDIEPGILSALHAGASVTHIHPENPPTDRWLERHYGKAYKCERLAGALL